MCLRTRGLCDICRRDGNLHSRSVTIGLRPIRLGALVDTKSCLAHFYNQSASMFQSGRRSNGVSAS